MFIDNLPKDEKTLKELLKVVESEILLHEKKFFEDEKSPMICRVLNDPSFSLKADSAVPNLILQDEKENEPPTVEPKVVEFPQSPQNDNKQIC